MRLGDALDEIANKVALAIRTASILRRGREYAALDVGDGAGVFLQQLIVLARRNRYGLAGGKVISLDHDTRPGIAQRSAAAEQRKVTRFIAAAPCRGTKPDNSCAYNSTSTYALQTAASHDMSQKAISSAKS